MTSCRMMSKGRLSALSGKKRKAAIEAIQIDCQAYITVPLLEALSLLITDDTGAEHREGLHPKIQSIKVQVVPGV